MKLHSGGAMKLLAFLIALVCSLSLTLLIGCAKKSALKEPAVVTQEQKPASAAPAAPASPEYEVSYHVWGALLYYGMEEKEYPGYAAYTYVLFNSNQSDVDSQEGKRYDGVLQAVLQDVKTRETGVTAHWPKYETNLFCVPFKARSPKKADALKEYALQLSQDYVATLQKSVKGNNKELFERLERRPGPFLISFYEPLPRLQKKEVGKMLYLDLTDMPADGMRQVLDAYRERLNAGPLTNMERLKESLKITLMRYALILDDNLKIVEIAFEKF